MSTCSVHCLSMGQGWLLVTLIMYSTYSQLLWWRGQRDRDRDRDREIISRGIFISGGMFLVLSILCNRYSKSPKVHPWGPKPHSFLSDGVTLCQPTVITQSRKKSVSTSLSTHDRTPSVGHCLGIASFQSISAATTANVSPFLLMSSFKSMVWICFFS